MEEVWKDIPGYEGLYQASNKGRLKSMIFSKHRILNPTKDRHGYLCTGLVKNKKQTSFRAHQLIAMAFLNHKRNGLNLVVNHINYDRLDNRIENLEIVSNRKNTNRKHLKSSSKYTGVCWHKAAKKWISYIRINGKLNYLGSFDSEIEASKAYQEKLLTLK